MEFILDKIVVPILAFLSAIAERIENFFDR